MLGREGPGAGRGGRRGNRGWGGGGAGGGPGTGRLRLQPGVKPGSDGVCKGRGQGLSGESGVAGLPSLPRSGAGLGPGRRRQSRVEATEQVRGMGGGDKARELSKAGERTGSGPRL